MSSFEPRPAAPEPRSKRMKIDVACNTCRARKVKCDGVRPACSNCSRKLELRNNCTYSQTSSVPSNTSTGIALPAYIRNAQDALDSPVTASGSHATPKPWMRDSTDRAPASFPPTNPSTTESLPESRASDEVFASARSRNQVNAVSPSVINSMTAVVDEGTKSREYFGSSSAGSFTAQIKRAIDARLSGGRSGGSRENNAASRQSVVSVSSVNHASIEANRVLPTRRQADRLMALYWKYVDPLYPFLDRQSWDQAYHGIFNGLSINVDEHIFIATLNIIFALCTQLQESMTWEQREASSNIFFARAQQLLPLNTWNPGTTELVQYLLLASQYLQSTDDPHQTWMVVGAAIRIAQGLGLHLSETAVERPELGHPSLLRRVWYGCVLMDRMVAVTHGRPPMMSSQLASALPLPKLSHHLDDPSSSVHSAETDPSFFVKSVELYEIIQSVYYGAGVLSRSVPTTEHSGHNAEEENDLCTVIQLDNALARWERSLPERLRCYFEGERDEITYRQAVVLYLRLLHARILLLRPILARFCLTQPRSRHGFSEHLEPHVRHHCAVLCATTAQTLVAALLKYQTADGSIGMLPAWWYRVYYVYTAATVLIAAKLRPDIFAGADLGRAWGQAMSVLKTHEGCGQSAQKCVAALFFLYSKILQDGSASGTVSRAPGHREDHPEQNGQDTSNQDQQMSMDDFSFPQIDFDQQHLNEVEFDVNNLAWLNDMHAAWDLLNGG